MSHVPAIPSIGPVETDEKPRPASPIAAGAPTHATAICAGEASLDSLRGRRQSYSPMTNDPSRPTCRIVDGLAQLAGMYDVVLCDVWGVVHDGHAAFPAAVEALTRFREGGGSVVLLTNAPRPSGSVIRQIETLGVPAHAYDAIVTSGDATIALIEARGAAPLYHIGPAKDVALFDELRDRTGLEPPLVGLDEARHVVCTGLVDDRSEGPDDYRPVLETMRARGLDMICANPDVVVHVGDRLIFCGGALAERYEQMGGTVHYAGKPHAPIYRVALKIAEARRGASSAPGRVLAIGDALRTDIAGARAQGLDSLFVAAGIHREGVLSPRTGLIDPRGLAELLGETDRKPVAAIRHLAW